MVRSVSPNCVSVAPSRVTSSSVSLQAIALANAVMEAVSSQEFTKNHLYNYFMWLRAGGERFLLLGTKKYILFAGMALFIKHERQISIAYRKKNLFGRVDMPLFQLLFQPGQIQAHSFQIVLQDMAVHNEFGEQQFLIRFKIYIFGCKRALTAYGKNRKLSVVFKHGGLDACQIKVSLLPAHDHEFTQVKLGFLKVFVV